MAYVLDQYNCSGNSHKRLLPPLGDVEETVDKKGYCHSKHKYGYCREATESKAVEESLDAFSEACERLAAFNEQRCKQSGKNRCNQNLANYSSYGSGHSSEQSALGEGEEIHPGKCLGFLVP